MLTLTISDEQLQVAFQKTLDDILLPGNYNNPVKRELDNILGYSGSMRGELGTQIQNYLFTALQSPEFQQMLGKSIADEMARRAVDAMEKKK
jgi:hypothetical protein